MADNENFDPTESLGPSFGGINQPSINPESFKPFEGEPLSFPTITFPKTLGAGSLTNNNDLVRDVVHTRADVPFKDRLKANIAYLSANAQANAPDNSSSKIFSYDASPDGNAFYKRYAAYGDEKFAKIGFSPFRDNEAIFNARTSVWDDSKRMLQHSFWPLFSSGFVAGPKSLMRMMEGDFGADPEEARIYADAAAIGQSSKKGFAAFMNNTAMNFAYTAGIITEAVLEEAVGLLLAIPTGGTSLAVTTGNNARKIPLIFRAIKSMSGIGKMGKDINQTLKQVDNISGARTFFDAARSKTGRFFNPFENITEAAYDIAKNENNLTGMARGFAAMNKTAGGFYRDVRNVNMALAEGRLEGGFVQNDVYDNLYNDYYSEHGKAPDDAMQRDMRNQAKEAGIETIQWNTALIYGSNKIVIPNIMGPRGGIRNFVKSKMAQEIAETPLGKIIAKPGEKIAGKLHRPEFSIETPGWKSTWNSFKRKPIRTGVVGLGNYFKANFTEGLQENAQEVIAESLKHYYTQSFQNPEMAAHLYSKGVFKEAFNAQFSAQGFETFAGGFMMGMFAAPLNRSIPAMSIGFNKLTDPKGYAEMKAERDQRGKRVVDNLNNLTSNPNAFFDSKLFNYAVQANVKDGIAAGNTKEGVDLREEAFITQINTAIENNTLDHFLSHIESYNDLTVDEFEEALGYEKGQGAQKQQEIGGLISKAKEIEKRHKYYNERFPDQVSMEGLEEGTAEYNAAAIYKNARRISIRNAVFFGEAFDNTMNRMNGVFNKMAGEVGLKNVNVSDIQNMFDNERMDNEAEILKTEIESLKMSTDPSMKRKLGEKQRKLDSYTKFNEASIQFQNWVKKQRYDSESLKDFSNQEIEEFDTKVLIEFELAYKEHIRTLGELAKDHVFDENLDKSFELLLDHYKLEDEAAHLGQYVNFLHNPKNFTDNIERNYEWMNELYQNRSEHYNALVQKGMADVENNNLLNKLANQDIYISKEDLENFVENNVIPEEFHRASNKSVIRRTHPLYAEIRNQFLELVETRATTEVKQFLKEAQDKINALNVKRDAEIAALPTTDTKESLGNIAKLKLKKLTVKRISSELKNGEYAEAKDADGNISIFYKDNDTLKYDDVDGNPVRLDAVKDQFESVEKYKIVKTPDAEAVKEINERYDLLAADILQNAIKNAQTFQTNEFIPITRDTPIEELPASLKEELLAGVPAYMEELGLIGEPEEHLVNYMREAEAENIINAYNDKQEELFNARQDGNVEARDLLKGNKMVSSADMTVAELETLSKDYYNKVQDAQAKSELTPKETLELSENQEILDYLERYILFRKTSLFSDKAKKVIDKIEYLKSIQDRITLTPYGYVINGKLHTRVTQSFESLKTEKYELSEDIIAKIEAAYATTIGEGKSINEFIDKLSKSNIPAFGLFTAKKLNAIAMDVVARRAIKSNTPGLKEIKAEIANLEAEIDSAKGQDGYTEILNNNKQKIKELTLKLPLTEKQGLALIINEIKEKTYEETRIGGNQIDGLLKDFFENVDAPFEYKPEYAKIIRDEETGDIISAGIQENAFNSLFGEPTVENPKGGFLYELREKVKSGQLYVAPAIKVYDSTALDGKGVAGEIDLLIVDQEGNASIVDVKTGRKSKWDGFKTLSGPEANRSKSAVNKYEDYSMQQTAYSNLLFNMTGIEADINILPVETTFEQADAELGKVLTAKDPGINKGNSWYNLKRTESIDTIIPRVSIPVATDGVPVDVLTEEQKETMGEPVGQTDDLEKSTSILESLKLSLAYEEAAVEEGYGSQELVDDLRKQIAELEALEEQPTTSTEAEIESRRKTAYSTIQFNYSTDEGYYGVYTDATGKKEIIENSNAKSVKKELKEKYDAELAALQQPSATPTNINTEVEESPLLSEFLNKTVYYKGEPYVVEKEGVKFILNSETKIIELEANENTTIADVDVTVIKRTTPDKKYNVSLVDDGVVIINDITYTINLNNLGNVESISPVNKPEQKIKNEAMLIAVDIERSKQDYTELEEIVDDVQDEHLEKVLSFEDRVALNALENAYQNMNSTVESALAKLYNPKTIGTLTEQEMLQADLFINDAYWRISELQEKNPNEIFTNALSTLEKINNILYSQNPEYYEIQRSKVTSTDESVKTRQKATAKRSPKKSTEQVEKPTEVEKESTTSTQSTEAKKAEIESEIKDLESKLEEAKNTLQPQAIEVLDENGNVINTSDNVVNLTNQIAQKKAELAALEEQNTTSTVDTKAVEQIEADRKAELESSREIKAFYDTDKPIKEDSQEIRDKITQLNKLREESRKLTKQAANESDLDKREQLNGQASSLLPEITELNKEIYYSRKQVLDSLPIRIAIKEAKITGQKLLTKIKLAANSNDWVSSMPLSKEEFNAFNDAIKFLSVKDMGEVTSNSEVIPKILLIEKINAKYDAELAALGQTFDSILEKRDENISYRESRANNLIKFAIDQQPGEFKDTDFFNTVTAIEDILLNNLGKEVDGYEITKEVIQDVFQLLKVHPNVNEKILKEFSDKADIKFYEIEKPTEVEKEITLADVEDMAQKVSSPERLNDLKAYLSEQFLIGNISDDVYNLSDNIINDRLIQIEKGINLEISLDNLVEGQELIVKNDIFTGSNKKLVSVNDTVIVKSTSNGKLTVALYGKPNVTKVVLEADVNKYFTTMELEKAKAKIAKEPMTEEDTNVIKENDSTLDSFLKNGDRLDALRKEASDESIEDIENTLLDELDC